MKTLLTQIAALNLVCVASVLGAELDQSQPALDPALIPFGIGGQSEQVLAQVVTAGRSGSLTAIGLPVAGVGTLIVQIQGINGGVPNGTVFASQAILGSSLPDFITDPTGFRQLELATPVDFSAGDRFAIVLKALTPSTDSFGFLSGPSGNPYAGGDGFFDSRPNAVGVWVALGDFGGFDLPFQTYVTSVPEPGILALLMQAGLITGILRAPQAKLSAMRFKIPVSN